MVPVPSKYETDIFMVKVNGVDLSKNLTKYVINDYDITSADTGMNDAGVTILEYVRKDKIKVQLEWKDIDSTYMKRIKDAFASGTITAEVVDGDYKESVTCNAYRGDRTRTMKRNGNNKPEWDFSVSIIEL